MAEMKTTSRAEWSWASIVLTKSSRSVAPSQPKLPTNLSTCPDRSTAGQVDRLVSTFKSSPVATADDVLDFSNSSHSGAGPCYSDSGEDRTGIVRRDAPIMREWAENCSRLNLDSPPDDVPLRRWHQLISDIDEFVGGGWAEKAARLGWTLGDLIGADPERPFARLDKAGLLWLLNGNRLVAICENTATIVTETAARQTYHPWQINTGLPPRMA